MAASSEIIEEEIQQTWNKFEQSAQKAGYREGLVAGKESVFQKYFDEGYAEGFKAGFALGKYKGVIKAHNVNKIDLKIESSDLEHPQLGSCQMCKDSSLLQNTVEQIKDLQRTHCNEIIKVLQTDYSKKSGIALLNSL